MIYPNKFAACLIAALLTSPTVAAFQAMEPKKCIASTTVLPMDRRNFGQAILTGGLVAGGVMVNQPSPALAEVFLDPAMYGDQELRVSAVDSIKEFVRRAILKKPSLAPSFFQLSLLDGLSYNAATRQFGPDGSVVNAVLSSKKDDENTKNLQEACLVLIDGAKILKKKIAITISDAVAIGGSEAIESIGGPVLAVQLGRTEPDKNAPLPPVPVDLFSGNRPSSDVTAVFRQAGLTEREMTALLGGLMTLQIVEKSRSSEDWKQSAKPKFIERGKMGRMSGFKALTEEDIAAAADDEFEEDEPSMFDEPDQYIAESFGTREERFGKRIGTNDIDEKSFNRYLKELDDATGKKGSGDLSKFGSIGLVLVDKENPVTKSWVNKYGSSNLNFLKDLKIAFNSVTQLGAVYTGGKYESLLKGKARKSLNDDLNLF